MPPKLLNALELSLAIGESYTDVMRWARQGAIPGFKLGGQWFFNLRQVVKALATDRYAEASATVTVK